MPRTGLYPTVFGPHLRASQSSYAILILRVRISMCLNVFRGIFYWPKNSSPKKNWKARIISDLTMPVALRRESSWLSSVSVGKALPGMYRETTARTRQVFSSSIARNRRAYWDGLLSGIYRQPCAGPSSSRAAGPTPRRRHALKDKSATISRCNWSDYVREYE